MNIYVGNLPYTTTDAELMQLFAPYGTVSSARVIMDRATSRSRGFGFVEMPNQEEGQKAIEQLNGSQMQGRALKINEARPREDRRSNRDAGRY